MTFPHLRIPLANDRPWLIVHPGALRIGDDRRQRMESSPRIAFVTNVHGSLDIPAAQRQKSKFEIVRPQEFLVVHHGEFEESLRGAERRSNLVNLAFPH